MKKIVIFFCTSLFFTDAFAACESLGTQLVSCEPGYYFQEGLSTRRCVKCPHTGQTTIDYNTGGINSCKLLNGTDKTGTYDLIGNKKTYKSCEANYYLKAPSNVLLGATCTICPDNGTSTKGNSEGITACTGMYDATGWYVFNTDGTKKYTKCVAGYYLENAKCEPCPDGTTSPNENTGGRNSCQISSDETGYYQEKDGKKIYSMCKAGYYFTNEKTCVECPDHGKSPDKNYKGITACTEMSTSTGWYEFDASGVAKYIKCVENYYLKNAVCNSCPSGGKSPDKNTGGITSCYTIVSTGTDNTGSFQTKENTECHYVE